MQLKLSKQQCVGAFPLFPAVIEPTYRDTRTVIYIWGKRLFAEPFAADDSGGHTSSASLCQPVILRSLEDVRIVEVVVGESHALFLSDNGKVFAYGEGAYGQLGLGEVQLLAKQPQLVKDFTGSVVQIAAGDYHSLALTEEVPILPSKDFGPRLVVPFLLIGEDKHWQTDLCWVFSQGSVFSWGSADCVGDGSGMNRFMPRELRLIDALPNRGTSSPVCRRIAARYSQSMAVMVGGYLLVWGQVFHARFFHAPRLTFVFSTAYKVIQIAIGKSFALALTGMRSTDCPAQRVPEQLCTCISAAAPGLRSACTLLLRLGIMCCCFAEDHGQVLAWGDGTYGELGKEGDTRQLFC